MIQKFVVELNSEHNGLTVSIESPYNSKRIAKLYLHTLGSSTKYIDNLDTIGVTIGGQEALPSNFPAPVLNSQFYAREGRTDGTLTKSKLMAPEFHTIDVNLPALGSTIEITYTAEDVDNMGTIAVVFECDDEAIPSKRVKYEVQETPTLIIPSASMLQAYNAYNTMYLGRIGSDFVVPTNLEKIFTGQSRKYTKLSAFTLAKSDDFINEVNTFYCMSYKDKCNVLLASITGDNPPATFNQTEHLAYSPIEFCIASNGAARVSEYFHEFLHQNWNGYSSDSHSSRLKRIIDAIMEIRVDETKVNVAMITPLWKIPFIQSGIAIDKVGNNLLRLSYSKIAFYNYIQEHIYALADEKWNYVSTTVHDYASPTYDYCKLLLIAQYYE